MEKIIQNLKVIKPLLTLSLLLAFQTNYIHATTVSKYPVLTFDVSGDPVLPQNFRSSQTPFPKEAQNPPSRKGLDSLNASGSGQFTGTNLLRMEKEINQSTGYIIDLRKESHGFLDNTPVNWYGIHNWDNKDRNAESIKSSEQRLLEVLGTMRKGTVYQKTKENDEMNFNPRNISFREAATEQRKISELSNFDYIRFYVLDHYPPDTATIDSFVDFVKKIKPSTWLHFHCLAGHGRTTTFLIMYDMLRNATVVSFEDIIKRQALIGGQDLSDTSIGESWQIPLNQKRLILLKNFYEYAKDEKEGYPKNSYGYWVKIKENPKKKRFFFF